MPFAGAAQPRSGTAQAPRRSEPALSAAEGAGSIPAVGGINRRSSSAEASAFASTFAEGFPRRVKLWGTRRWTRKLWRTRRRTDERRSPPIRIQPWSAGACPEQSRTGPRPRNPASKGELAPLYNLRNPVICGLTCPRLLGRSGSDSVCSAGSVVSSPVCSPVLL